MRTRLLILAFFIILGVWGWGLSARSGEGQVSPGRRSLTALEPHYRAGVIRGWRSFQTSLAGDGMACAHCHPQPEDMTDWARAYPKVEVFDGTPYRVKGLGQVVLEALEKHTDLSGDERSSLVQDLVAYLAWKGEGEPVRPGFSKPFPPAPADLAELAAAAKRGAAIFADPGFGPCARCHDPGDKAAAGEKIALGRAAATFPGFVTAACRLMSLETFLSWHLAEEKIGGYSPESREIADLAAYLAQQAAGKRMRPGRLRTGKKEKP